MTLNRMSLYLVAFVAAVSIPVSAHAQMDLLKRGQDALKSIQGGSGSGGSASPAAALTDSEIGRRVARSPDRGRSYRGIAGRRDKWL